MAARFLSSIFLTLASCATAERTGPSAPSTSTQAIATFLDVIDCSLCCLLTRDHELDPPVLIAPLGRAVVGDRQGLAETLGLHARARDALALEVLRHRLGARLRQLHVEGVAAAAVGVALDPHVDA